jgi:hypothetical protein
VVRQGDFSCFAPTPCQTTAQILGSWVPSDQRGVAYAPSSITMAGGAGNTATLGGGTSSGFGVVGLVSSRRHNALPSSAFKSRLVLHPDGRPHVLYPRLTLVVAWPQIVPNEFLFGSERAALAAVRPVLLDIQEGRCFYCHGSLKAGATHVDHFVVSTSDISSDRFYPLPAFWRTISQTDPTRRCPSERTRRTYERLLATVTNAEHRAALSLLPRFGHLCTREAYIAAMREVRSSY